MSDADPPIGDRPVDWHDELDGERRARLIDQGVPAEAVGPVPIDRKARIGFFLLALGLIDLAISEGGGGNENTRLAKFIGLRLLEEAERLP